jgi:tRNA (guanine-N7-)-methyltransferase
VTRFHIYFPDPWPKKRHHKRRLINPENVALLVQKLAPKGELHLATDWEHYARQMQTICEAEPRLSNLAGTGKQASRSSMRILTKYEKKALEEKRAISDFIFVKQSCLS